MKLRWVSVNVMQECVYVCMIKHDDDDDRLNGQKLVFFFFFFVEAIVNGEYKEGKCQNEMCFTLSSSNFTFMSSSPPLEAIDD